ncbi:hypothetical protein [Streptomyces sp. NPDC058294]|uniref:hypothetical protein n=1 Tax=Streptomyces sp. NPDC058294 TaxID=3346430 RepID=UPI0036E3A4AC
MVVVHDGRLHFGALQGRARRRGRGAAAAAVQRPAHLIVFDVLEASGVALLDRPRERRSLTSSSTADSSCSAAYRPPAL